MPPDTCFYDEFPALNESVLIKNIIMIKKIFVQRFVLLLINIMILLNSFAQKKDTGLYRTILLRENWKLQSSAKLEGVDGSIISKKEYKANNWHNAIVPGTVMGNLVADSIIIDPYFGINLKKVNKKQFEQPWWYRTSFDLSKDDLKKQINIRIKGINYRADLWINGKKVAGKDKFYGAFNMFTFNINDYVIAGENIIAIELWQPVAGEYSIGFVDWNPQPPDKSMGVFRDVVLEINQGLKIRSPFVSATVDKNTLNDAQLTIQTELENSTQSNISGILKVDFSLGTFEKNIEIPAGETVSCRFTDNDFKQLNVHNVKLWWPNGFGEANLYDVNISFVSKNKTIDSVSTKYGIRQIDSYINKEGNRVVEVNGKFVLIKGGGWVDDLLLQDTKESIEAQIRYVKHMGLNSIRLEGFWGKDESLYNLCDKYGILIMVGWSCHWEWDEYLGKETHSKYMAYGNKEDIKLLTSYWKSQLLWLRNHPSIYLWMLGSDKLPAPELEKNYLNLFQKYDMTRPWATSAGGVGSDQGIVGEDVLVSEISGPTGMKMLGPYAYTPPVYWFTDTNLGGAYGFNTETCPGPNISPLASLKKMLPEKYLWPIDKEYWEYHCGRNAFQTLDRYRTAINARYGKSKSIEEFAFKSQLMNYELMRPMFEAFIAHKPQSTGLIQWMLNSAWPEMYWQLYDSYLQPNGAFYAVKKSNQAIHAIYRYGKDDIFLSNNQLKDVKNVKVLIRAYDINSKLIYTDEWKGNIKANSSMFIKKLPQISGLTNVWFLDLRVYDSQTKEIDRNFYYLSLKKDELDYKAAEKLPWAFYTPSKSYADYSALNKLPDVRLQTVYNFTKTDKYAKVSLSLKNTSNSIAFFVYMDVVDNATNEPVLPIYWTDNYISLLPGEEQKYEAYYPLAVFSDKPAIIIRGWNVSKQKNK